MNVVQITFDALIGGQSSKLTLAATSVQTTPIVAPTNHPPRTPIKCTFAASVNVFFRKGVGTAVAVADGTDQFCYGGNLVRTELLPGEVIAFIPESGSTGTVYFTPGA